MCAGPSIYLSPACLSTASRWRRVVHANSGESAAADVAALGPCRGAWLCARSAMRPVGYAPGQLCAPVGCAPGRLCARPAPGPVHAHLGRAPEWSAQVGGTRAPRRPRYHSTRRAGNLRPTKRRVRAREARGRAALFSSSARLATTLSPPVCSRQPRQQERRRRGAVDPCASAAASAMAISASMRSGQAVLGGDRAGDKQPAAQSRAPLRRGDARDLLRRIAAMGRPATLAAVERRELVGPVADHRGRPGSPDTPASAAGRGSPWPRRRP